MHPMKYPIISTHTIDKIKKITPFQKNSFPTFNIYIRLITKSLKKTENLIDNYSNMNYSKCNDGT